MLSQTERWNFTHVDFGHCQTHSIKVSVLLFCLLVTAKRQILGNSFQIPMNSHNAVSKGSPYREFYRISLSQGGLLLHLNHSVCERRLTRMQQWASTCDLCLPRFPKPQVGSHLDDFWPLNSSQDSKSSISCTAPGGYWSKISKTQSLMSKLLLGQ